MRDFMVRLEQLLDEFVARLDADPVFGSLINGTITAPRLTRVYEQIWHCLKSSTPALRAAGDSIALYGTEDPAFAAEPFARYKTDLYRDLAGELRRHGDEESGHDDWMQADLAALDFSAAQLQRSTPGAAMAAYVAGIQHAASSPTPAGVAGQAWILEGISERRWGLAVERLLSRSRIPGIGEAVSCLALHAEADIGHCERARARLRRIEDPRDQTAILHNARWTIETWGLVGHEILRREASSRRSAPADLRRSAGA